MIQAVQAMTEPPGRPEHPPERGSGPPERDCGPVEPALATWEQVAEFVGSAYRVEREWPGHGLILWVSLASGARPFILAKSFPARAASGT